MFEKNVYIQRRNLLKKQLGTGLVLFLGHDDSPMNYSDNPYPFRQDSSFLYFFGLDVPGLAVVIDIDQGRETLYGNDLTIDDIIWTGPKPSVSQRAQAAGISETASLDKLQSVLEKAVSQNRQLHTLPLFRPETRIKLEQLLQIRSPEIDRWVSEPLIKAVVAQRSIKSSDEIAQIEAALDITYEMHIASMQMTRPGIYEREVAGPLEGIALARGGRLSFLTIFSVDGQTMHNHYHGNLMQPGDIVVNDSGAESTLHYVADITRTIPVSGAFTSRQRDVYQIVFNAQEKAIAALMPGVEFRDIHRLACTELATGLKELGLIKGNVDDAVNASAHTLFFQCGLGHMIGLDVHDMEGLGEDYVGYTETIKRNPEFGWRCLRLARSIEPGFVLTVEPGLYFIPELIDCWQAENKCADFINYDQVDKYRDFGGIRIEDDLLITETAFRILGPHIPRTISEVQQACSS